MHNVYYWFGVVFFWLTCLTVTTCLVLISIYPVKQGCKWIYKHWFWPFLRRTNWYWNRDYRKFKRKYVDESFVLDENGGIALHLFEIKKDNEHRRFTDIVALYPQIWDISPEAYQGYKQAKFDYENGIK